MEKLLGVFDTVDDAVEAAAVAQKDLVKKFTMKDRDKMIAAIRQIFVENAQQISEMTVTESKLGRVEDKVQKLIMGATGTPGTEVMKANIYSSHDGLTVEEQAPYGVIGAITPVTNPTETIIGNGISMLAGGNAVVFNVHPSAKNISAFGVDLMNKAIASAGGPLNLITMVKEPTLETVEEICKHPKTKLLVGTGGPAMVKTLLKAGKKVVAAGSGNPPVIIDETANIEVAGATIVVSSSFDNNLLCIGEKEVFVLDSVADKLVESMTKNGAYLLNQDQAKKIVEIAMDKDENNTYHVNRTYVGQDAGNILKAIGIEGYDDIRLLIFETDFTNPFVQVEQMMPVLPIVRCSSFEQALEYAVEAEHDCKHSAAIWSNNTERVTQFGKVINTTIFVQNGATMAGIGFGGSGTSTATIATPTGEGITNALSFTRRRRFVMANGANYIL